MLNKKTSFIIYFVIFSLVFLKSYSIKLGIPNFKPYTYEENGKENGIGIVFLKEVMKNLDNTYEIIFLENYERALIETKKGNIDGFLLATQNSERDKIAIFSEPFFYNNWSWILLKKSIFSPKSNDFKSKARVTTLLNTNTHKWLIKNKYKVFNPTTKLKLLPRLLTLKRVDAIFISELVFVEILKENNLNVGHYKIINEKKLPFGMYISKEYIKKNPNFMKKLNIAIKKVKTK